MDTPRTSHLHLQLDPQISSRNANVFFYLEAMVYVA